MEVISSESEGAQEVESSFNHACEYNASIASLEKDLEAYDTEVRLLQQKISSTKAQLLVRYKARLVALQNQSLVVVSDGEQEQGILEASETTHGEAEDEDEARASVRQSSRPRKEPNWHKDFVKDRFG